MGTFHGDGMKRLVDDNMCDVEYATLISKYLLGLRTGKYQKLLVDSVFQKNNSSGGRANIYDAHAFMDVHSRIMNGQLATCSIPVGCGPLEDADVTGNNEILKQLPDGLAAEFNPGRGGGANDDGVFKWPFELGAWSSQIRDEGKTHDNLKFWFKPGRVPLEIGTTAGSRTFAHLLRGGGLCRWPYGSDSLFLILPTDGVMFECRRQLASTTPCDCFEGISK